LQDAEKFIVDRHAHRSGALATLLAANGVDRACSEVDIAPRQPELRPAIEAGVDRDEYRPTVDGAWQLGK
jgi:hypothetical protein